MAETNKVVYTGPVGSGKTTKLAENIMNFAGKGQTLILLPDNTRSNEWRKKLAMAVPFQPEIQSYSSFIRKELEIYYPIVLENCSAIKKRDMQPLFLNYDSARFILYKVIDKKREAEFLFSPVACDSMEIASELCSGLIRAAKQGIPFEQTGARMKAAYSSSNGVKERIFTEADAILGAFRAKCLELGVLDQSMAIYIYNDYLLTDKRYLDALKKRFRHLIVDDLEQMPPAALRLIKHLEDKALSAAYGFNPEAAAAAGEGSFLKVLESEIIQTCTINRLKGSFTCSPSMFELSDALPSVITGIEKKYVQTGVKVEMVTPLELRSEMLEAAGRRIVELVRRDGIHPSDIAVLSTFADPVTEHFLSDILSESGINIKNVNGRARASESTVIRSLLALARMCFPMLRLYPGKDNMRILIKMIFAADTVSSAVLSELILNQKPFSFMPDWDIAREAAGLDPLLKEKYDYVKLWCDSRRDSSPKLPEFFRRACLEVLGCNLDSRDEINEVKQLVDESTDFVEAVSRFIKNPARDYLDFMGSGANITLKGIEQDISEEYVRLMNPSAMLSYKASFKVIIILSASSRNWMPLISGGLMNSLALTAGRETDKILTGDEDEAERRRILASSIGCALKKCMGELIIFQSDLSANGYENDGILASCISEVIGGS